jgi:putative ABC transport system permease protein
VESIFKDIRYGLRVLWKSRGFTLVAILTLALGIGATTAVFSVINAVLLRPLPLGHPEQLATISSEELSSHTPGIGASWTKFQFMREQQREFSGVAAFSNRQVNFANGHEAVQVPAHLRVPISSRCSALHPLRDAIFRPRKKTLARLRWRL